MNQKGSNLDLRDADRRMRAYKIFMNIRADGVQAEVTHDDTPVVETRRVVTIEFDKPSGAMKKRGSAKKDDAIAGGGKPLVMKCVVYELDMSV